MTTLKSDFSKMNKSDDPSTMPNETIIKRRNAFEIYEEELLFSPLVSYIENLDTILKGEIIPKSIVELTGEPGSGKTQICFLLSISVQLPKCIGGVGGEALYICTNQNFSTQRILELSKSFVDKYETVKMKTNISKGNCDFNAEYILNHIHYVNVENVAELLASVVYLKDFLTTNTNVKIVIIDSISYILRTIESTNERNQIVLRLFSNLQRLSEQFNFCTVITNDLTTRIDDKNYFTTPSFGDSFYHFVNTRIWLSRKYGNCFSAKITKSIIKRSQEVTFGFY